MLRLLLFALIDDEEDGKAEADAEEEGEEEDEEEDAEAIVPFEWDESSDSELPLESISLVRRRGEVNLAQSRAGDSSLPSGH